MSRVTLESAMLAVISCVLLVGTLYIILSGAYDEGTRNWAYATVGSIVGFWLRAERTAQSSPMVSVQEEKPQN